MELKEIEKKIQEIMPVECGLTKVEPEGLDIVIYIKDINKFYQNDQLIKRIASAVRKRVFIRSDPTFLTPAEDSMAIIKGLIPEEAGVTEITFNPDFCEVNIEALKPGLVIGKGGLTLRSIIQKTGWAPNVLRAPTMDSSTIRGVRKSLLRDTAARKKFLLGLGKKICTPVPKSDWVKITALGGYQEVGRSCTLLQTPNSKVLIDCGINPDTSDNTRTYPYLNAMGLEPEQLDAVILTHAHLDHSGFIPYLYAYGYDGPVYCTTPTRELAILLQMDYINVLNKNTDQGAPYGVKDIQKQLTRMITLDYWDVMDITPEIKLTYYNAGHILGSAIAHLHIGEGLHNLVFSGDIKYGYSKLFDQSVTSFPRCETLFLESTYGGRDDVQANRFDSDKKLFNLILETIKRKGKVLIPVFSVGRAQEIMLVLEEFMAKKNDYSFPVYIDGMILEASAIHTAYPQYLRHNVQMRILSNDSPFESHIFETVKTDRREIVDGEPAVILAPSGMLSGGPSLEYFRMLADDPKNSLLFVGYQSSLSMGRKLQRGQREFPMLGEDGKMQTVKVNMHVETVEGYSGHSDRHQLLSFLKNIKPKPERVFTLHGDEQKCDDLARTINRVMRIDARAPMDLDAIRLK
ncbi:MAG: beta-CASP ribonuclease aCPSF1 [Candidatus Micrarchaeia archaeon]